MSQVRKKHCCSYPKDIQLCSVGLFAKVLIIWQPNTDANGILQRKVQKNYTKKINNIFFVKQYPDLSPCTPFFQLLQFINLLNGSVVPRCSHLLLYLLEHGFCSRGSLQFILPRTILLGVSSTTTVLIQHPCFHKLCVFKNGGHNIFVGVVVHDKPTPSP